MSLRQLLMVLGGSRPGSRRAIVSVVVGMAVGLVAFSGDIDTALAASPVFVRADGDDSCDGTVDAAGPGTNCAFKTVQKGVNTVTSGGIVNVKAGTYKETVTISQPVDLRGSNVGKDPRNGGARDPETIMDGESTRTLFVINANSVTIDGFKVTGGNSASFDSAIYANPANSNWTIRNNIITGNQKGVYAHCAGSCLIQKNLFDANNLPGAAGGVSIYTFNTHGLTVDQNELTGNTLNSVFNLDPFSPNAIENVSFTNNYVHGNTTTSSAVVITGHNVGTGTFSNNRIDHPAGTAINFGGNSTNVTVQNNDLSGSLRGVRVRNFGAGPNSNLTVTQNSLASNATAGLAIDSGAYTGTLSAENNWWGSIEGPTNASNPDGAGSIVDNGVDFTTWLCSGTDTSGNIGFQPNASLTCPVPQPAIATVFVRNDGSDVACNGSANVAFSEPVFPNCALKRVQKGATVVQSAGTVNVAAGTYAEDVSLAKPLTLNGANMGKDPRTGGDTRVAETILNGTTTTVTIASDNVAVDGFTVKGIGTGVLFSPAKSTTQLRNTIVTDNVIGVYPSCVNACTIQKNLFDSNNRSGPAGGAGIYTDFPTNGLAVTENEFKNHNINSSVIFASAAAGTHHNLTFTSNLVQSSTPPDSAVYLVDVATATISSNKIAQTNGTALSLASGNSNITVQNNDFAGSMKGVRIQDDGYGLGNNSAVTVSLNSFVSNSQYGLNLVDGYTGTLNATRNWWGNVNGPTNAANTGGTGTTVMGSPVDFSPWLGDGTDTSTSIGFQPNLSPLFALATDGINVAPLTGLVTTENGGTAQFAIVLASAPTANVTIPLSSSNTNEGTVNPTSVTFTPANWNVPQTVTVTGVALAPGNGNVAYTIITGLASSTDPSFNGLTVADVAVTNSSAVVPSLSIADASVTEGLSTTVTMTFNVTLSQASPNTITVSYGTQNQTATADSRGDYVTAIGTLTFNPGETSKTIDVSVVADGRPEQDETFLVGLSNPSNATISRGQATGTIKDNALGASSCSVKPDILVQTQSIGGRQMLVTITADVSAPNETNGLKTIKFGTPTNATIQMSGQTTIGTGVITLPSSTRRISFTVSQLNAASAFTVPYTVSDNCGSVDKFVGGGANALSN